MIGWKEDEWMGVVDGSELKSSSAWKDNNVSVMTQGCLTQASRPIVCLFILRDMSPRNFTL